ncbi:MAG: hypothetical protein LBK13_04825 [Spirochaetales bacterium]|jgi:hypothetical protein|nr:hypothetical protein [Spirochaetales bacterium]
MKKNYTIVFAVIAALIALCAFWSCDSGGDDDSGSAGSVGSANDLMKIGTQGYPLNGNYELTADIILPSNWTPIGSGNAPFTGTFDGKGHSIIINSTTASSIAVRSFSSGLDISSAPFAAEGSVTGGIIARGLFAYTENATIKDMNITIGPGSSFVITSTAADQLQLFGTVAAIALNTAFTNINISGGRLKVNASSTDTLMLGGIAGTLWEGSSITGCSMSGGVKVSGGNEDYIGGLAGCADGCFIANSFVSGDVKVSGSTMNQTGGLVGSQEEGIIENCYVSGNVSASSTTDSSAAGGLAGHLGGDSLKVIRKSYSSGTVSATSVSDDARAGGIAGTSYKETEITDCYSIGEISASAGASADAGGIAGHFNIVDASTITIECCYASGNIIAGSGSKKRAGSIAGSAKVEGTGSGSITVCAALSVSVTGGAGETHRIAGETDFSLSNNIANSAMSGSSNASGQDGENKSSSDLALEATYTARGWDFSTVWKMSGASPSRPILKWQ